MYNLLPGPIHKMESTSVLFFIFSMLVFIVLTSFIVCMVYLRKVVTLARTMFRPRSKSQSLAIKLESGSRSPLMKHTSLRQYLVESQQFDFQRFSSKKNELDKLATIAIEQHNPDQTLETYLLRAQASSYNLEKANDNVIEELVATAISIVADIHVPVKRDAIRVFCNRKGVINQGYTSAPTPPNSPSFSPVSLGWSSPSRSSSEGSSSAQEATSVRSLPSIPLTPSPSFESLSTIGPITPPSSHVTIRRNVQVIEKAKVPSMPDLSQPRYLYRVPSNRPKLRSAYPKTPYLQDEHLQRPIFPTTPFPIARPFERRSTAAAALMGPDSVQGSTRRH